MQTGQTVRTYALCVSGDIAAKTATIAPQRPGTNAGRSLTLAQTPEGSTSLLQQLQATRSVPSQVLVVMEATGSYWIRVAPRLVHAGCAVRVMHPAHAPHCATALLKRAKTDAIDTQTLAQ